MHPRRYYTVLAAAALLEGSTAVASVCRGHRSTYAGTAFPVGFPNDALNAAGYELLEDFGDPASDPDPEEARAELRSELRRSGLRAADVATVLDAL